MSPSPILIVDDEPDMLWALDVLLRGEGLTVLSVGNASDALQIVSTNPGLGMVITDGKLPDIDGLDLAEQIFSERGGRVPVAILSGFYDQHHPQVLSAIERGSICCFIAKPFDRAELIETINNFSL